MIVHKIKSDDKSEKFISTFLFSMAFLCSSFWHSNIFILLPSFFIFICVILHLEMNRLKVNIWGIFFFMVRELRVLLFSFMRFWHSRLARKIYGSHSSCLHFSSDTQNVFMMANVCTFLFYVLQSLWLDGDDTAPEPARSTNFHSLTTTDDGMKNRRLSEWMHTETHSHVHRLQLLMLIFHMHFTLLGITSSSFETEDRWINGFVRVYSELSTSKPSSHRHLKTIVVSHSARIPPKKD